MAEQKAVMTVEWKVVFMVASMVGYWVALTADLTDSTWADM